MSKPSGLTVLILIAVMIPTVSPGLMMTSMEPLEDDFNDITATVIKIPEQPMAWVPEFIIVNISGSFENGPELEVNGTIHVIGLTHYKYRFGNYILPMIPLSTNLYVGMIPGMPAHDGWIWDVVTNVSYRIIVDNHTVYEDSYNVAFETLEVDLPPLVLAVVHDVIDDPTLLEETFGLAPHGWRVASGEPVDILVIAIDDKEIKEVSFEYAVSGGEWIELSLDADPLMEEFSSLIDEINNYIIWYIIPNINEVIDTLMPFLKIYRTTMPGQSSGNYVMFRANATDSGGSMSTSPLGLYYVANETSSTRVLIVDPNVVCWVLDRNIESFADKLITWLGSELENIPIWDIICKLNSLIRTARKFFRVKFHHWELIGKYFDIYIAAPCKDIADLLKSLDEGGFEPHVVILSNLWLGVNGSGRFLNWDLGDIKLANGKTLQRLLIDYVKSHNAGLIATHATLSDWIIWTGTSPNQQFKIGARGHVGASMSDIYSEDTISVLLGLYLLPVWEYVRDTIATILYQTSEPELGALVGSLPLQIPFIPFKGSLKATSVGEGHPILTGIPHEFYVEIPDIPDILLNYGYKAYTQIGWQLSMPSALAYASWYWINKSLPQIKAFINNLTEMIENFTREYFSPPRQLNELMTEALSWGLSSIYDAIINMNLTDSSLAIRLNMPKYRPVNFSISMDYTALLRYLPMKLIAVSENGAAGIIAYDKFWDIEGYRSVYFSVEIEASPTTMAEKLLKNAVEWASGWEYSGDVGLIGGILRATKELAEAFKQAINTTSGFSFLSRSIVGVEQGYASINLSATSGTYVNLIVASSSCEKVEAVILEGMDRAEIVSSRALTRGLSNITIRIYNNGDVVIGLYPVNPELSISPMYVEGKIVDVVPPTITAIIGPGDGSFVRGIVEITVEVVDNMDVREVDLYLDGELIIEDTERPWLLALNTTNYTDGGHVILIRATDVADNTAESTLYLIFDNTPPTVVILDQMPAEPREDQKVIIKVRVEDTTSGVYKVMLWYAADDEWISIEMKAEDTFWEAEVPGFQAGTIVKYYIEAYDAAGNIIKSEMHSYTVKQGAPASMPLASSSIFYVVVGVALSAITILSLTFIIRRRK